jgi:hypothetical protein
MSTEELAEQMKQIHIHSQQVDEQTRAIRKVGECRKCKLRVFVTNFAWPDTDQDT